MVLALYDLVSFMMFLFDNRRSSGFARSLMVGAISLAFASSSFAQSAPDPIVAAPVEPSPVAPVPAAPAAGGFQPPAAEAPATAPKRKVVQKKRTPKRTAVKRGSAARVAAATSRARVVLKDDPRPSFTPRTFIDTANAAQRYLDIVERGGWPEIPKALSPGAKGATVVALRERLLAEGDIASPEGEVYDDELKQAVKRFQYRYGLTQNGVVSGATLEAINVPARVRFHQLNESARRMAGRDFSFGQRYVVVNIPAASAEAIANGQVEQRHVAVVGRPDRASPEVTSRITDVNFNPTWTVPKSIAEKDLVPKIRKNRGTLAAMKLEVLDPRGKVISASKVNWADDKVWEKVTLRQVPGNHNSLGNVRINMPNNDAVFMHDTPNKELFGSDFRFNSSGCVRVEGVRDLAAWLLGPEGKDRAFVDSEIKSGERTDTRLASPVPVTWVYLTGFVTEDGLVNFRDDIYGLDVPRYASNQ